MLNFCGIVVAILKMATQHCPISTPFHVWVDYDVPELIPDIEKFLLVSIFKMATTISQKFNIEWRLLEIFQFLESIQDIIIYPHIKF
jgi:hypothetical protein